MADEIVKYSWFIEESGNLVYPHGDPYIHEYPVNHVFDTTEDALTFLEEHELREEAVEERWKLCRVTTKVVHTL